MRPSLGLNYLVNKASVSASDIAGISVHPCPTHDKLEAGAIEADD